MRSGNVIDYSLRGEFGLWLKHLGKARLEFEFSAICARLGTEAERPEDADSGRAIGRHLHNLSAPSPTIIGVIPTKFSGYVRGSCRARVCRPGKPEPP